MHQEQGRSIHTSDLLAVIPVWLPDYSFDILVENSSLHVVIHNGKDICALELMMTNGSTELNVGSSRVSLLNRCQSSVKYEVSLYSLVQMTKYVPIIKPEEGERFLNGLCFGLRSTSLLFQSTRDIETRMRNETRLKLFTLDPDTQVGQCKIS